MERAAHRALEELAHAAVRLRRLERVLHLTENLRLADDERIEGRGDAEEVTDGVLLDVRAEVARDAGRAALFRVLGDDPLDVARGRHAVRLGVALGDRVDLGSVAGRHAERLAQAGAIEQRFEKSRNGVAVDRQSLAHFERSFAVGEPDDDDQRRPPKAPS